MKTMQEKEPEKYATFWTELGRAVKEGLLSDHENQKAILDICSFSSTHDPEKPTTLRDYLARMPEGQDAIYYATGESRAALESSPHMEAFRAKGYEVLLLTDPIDEVWVGAVPSFEEKPLASIATGEVDLGGDEVDDDTKKGFDALLTWMASALADDVKEVRLSHRLTESAAVLVGDPGDLTPTLEKMYRAMGQEPPKVKRILELNPRHALVTSLRDAHDQRPDDAGLGDTARLLHGMALLAEGGELAEPGGVRRDAVAAAGEVALLSRPSSSDRFPLPEDRLTAPAPTESDVPRPPAPVVGPGDLQPLHSGPEQVDGAEQVHLGVDEPDELDDGTADERHLFAARRRLRVHGVSGHGVEQRCGAWQRHAGDEQLRHAAGREPDRVRPGRAVAFPLDPLNRPPVPADQIGEVCQVLLGCHRRVGAPLAHRRRSSRRGMRRPSQLRPTIPVERQ